MSPSVRVALALWPLSTYFFALGVLQSGRRPRVLNGPVDFLMLAAGLSGLLVFGPVGEILVRSLFPVVSLWAWLALASSYALLALLWSGRAARRLVIYNVAPEALEPALREAMSQLPGAFVPSVRGFEDASNGRGVTFEVGARLHTGVVEAYGSEPEPLIARLGPALRERLLDSAAPRTGSAPIWFFLSTLTLLFPLGMLGMSRPRLLNALRVLFQRLGGH